MRRRPLVTEIMTVTLGAALSVAGGCSFIFTEPLSRMHQPGDVPACSTSRAPPVLDTILTATNVASAVYVAGKDDAPNKGLAVTAGAAAAILWAASATYGYVKTSQCEAAFEESRAYPSRYR